MRTCLLDVDGVLADFVAGALRVHHKPDPYGHTANRGNYYIQDLLQIPNNVFWAAFDEDFWFSLDKTPDADDIYQYCIRKFGADNVCFLTTPVRTYGCLEGKRRWLQRWFPKTPFLIGKPKWFCAHKDAFLIDDSDANVDSFIAAGGRAFLVPRPWNSAHAFKGNPVEKLDEVVSGRMMTPAGDIRRNHEV